MIFRTCNNPVEVFLHAAGAFFFGKNEIPGILRHVIALLRSSMCRRRFFLANSDSQIALAIFVIGDDL